VAIGYDQAGTFNERFAVKPTGAIAVAGNTGASGQVLQSNGAASAATWATPTSSLYNNTYQAVCTSPIALATSTPEIPIPGLSVTFTTAGNARVVAMTQVGVTTITCVLCSGSDARIALVLDGSTVVAPFVGLGDHQYADLSRLWMMNVGPGTHTIRVDALTPVGTNGVSYGEPTNSNLFVQVIPQ